SISARNIDSRSGWNAQQRPKEPALRFDCYKFLFHRARLATFATLSAMKRREQMQQKTCASARLLDHFIGAQQDRGRYFETEGLGGLDVDYQLELRRQLDRQVGGFCTAEHLCDHPAQLPISVEEVWPVGHQSTGTREVGKERLRRKPVSERKV